MEQYTLPPYALACARKHLILLFNPWISVQYSKEMITCNCFKLSGILGSDICLIQNDERPKLTAFVAIMTQEHQGSDSLSADNPTAQS